ncbi:MAG: polysaccharide deacetylase family protein, partial [Acidimicrobiales bacterium]
MTTRRVLLTVLGVSLAGPGVGAGGAARPAQASIAATPAPSGAACPAPVPGARFYAPGSGRTVALTFDDGPGTTTPALLAVLRRYDVPATLFNIGEQEATYPQDVVAEADDGFVLGNHTWSHPQLTTLSAAGQASQLDQTSAEQASLVGFPPCVLRPPYGSYNPTTLAVTAARRMSVWMWSVDTEDWMAGGSSSSYWVRR